MSNIHRPQSGRDLTPRDAFQSVSMPQASDPSAAARVALDGTLEYWRIVQRRKWMIALVALLGALGGVLYTLPKAPVYQARTVIEIQGLNENFLHMKDVNPTDTSPAGSDPMTELQTQVQILQSRSLLDRVTKKLLSENRLSAAPVIPLGGWRAVLHLPQPAPLSPRERAVLAAAANLHVRAQLNTRLVEVLTESTDGKIAAEFANTLTSEFIEQNLEARWQTARHTGEWLTRQMQDLRVKLETSEEAMQAYARVANLIITDEKEDAASQKLRQLQEELSRAQSERIARQSKYELANRAPADSLAEVLDDPGLREIQGKLTDLRRQHAELSSSLTDENPRVQKVQAQIAALESALQQERLNIQGRIRNDFESAERREKLLTADYAVAIRAVADQADKITHYNTLKREADTNRQLFESILQRVKEAGIASALRASNISVVDPALVPNAPSGPSTFKNTAWGLLAGLIFGVASAVFLDRAERRIQEPGDLGFYLGVPELGVVNSYSTDSNLRRQLSLSRKKLAGTTPAMAMVALQRRPSAVADSIRTTLTSILFSTHNGVALRVVVVASGSPNEGKTTLVTNLGIALAEIQQRVLLIDADLRRPAVHRFFDLDNDRGLVDLLRRDQPVSGPLNGLARTTGIANLSVLTSGPAQDGDPLLLHSERLAEILRIARNEYDVVIIDTPPILNIPDARIVARHADGVVLVARANKTSSHSVVDAHRRLMDDDTPVIGAILNDWDPGKSARYGYAGEYRQFREYHRETAH